MMRAAFERQGHTETITGGRLRRTGRAFRWLLGGGPRRVGAVYVEAPTSAIMPTDLAFLAVMRLLRRPVGVYFRDAYQLFRDTYPRQSRRQLLSDWLWRITMPMLRGVASERYAPSAGLAEALHLRNPVLLPPGTDPSQPNLGAGSGPVVAYVGGTTPADGFDTLLAAMARVRERVGDARLDLIGAPPRGELPDFATTHRSARDGLAELLAPARVCVIPRPINPYSNLAVPVKLWDYLSFGKPIVATAATETVAILAASSAGIATPDTPDDLAAGLLRVLADEGEAERLANHARLFAMDASNTWDARARLVRSRLIEGQTSGAAARPIHLAFIADPNSVHVRRWVGHFLARGYRVTLLAPRNQTITLDYPPEVSVERYRPQTDWRPSVLGLIGTGLSARNAIRRVRPDIVHVQHLTVNGLRAWTSRFHPYVITVWGNDVLIDPRRSRKSRVLARLALGSADLVTGISRHVVNAAIEFGAKPGRTRVLHHGIDVERFSPGPAPADLRARLDLDGRRVLFSPRLIEPLYRHDVVVDALATLPDDVCLVMTRYAATESEVAAMERRIAELGLGSRVRIVPGIPYDEMPAYYRLADVVVSVPESDAGPVTLVEALGVERPVVCSDLPPVREWLADLDPGALVPVGDVAATAAAISRALSMSPETRREIAARGRAEVVKRADERQTMAEMDRLYRQLAGPRLLRSRR